MCPSLEVCAVTRQASELVMFLLAHTRQLEHCVLMDDRHKMCHSGLATKLCLFIDKIIILVCALF